MALNVGSKLIDLLTVCYNCDVPPLLLGGTGIGKSEIIQELASRLKIGYVVIDLSLKEPSDLVGIPVIADGTTRFAPPADLPRDGKGILMIEEINRAQPYMLAPTLQLLTARRLNDYVLPKGWLPMAAANPADGHYIGTRQLDAALQARFMKIEVNPDQTSWLAWAGSNGVHPKVLEYVRVTPEIFKPIQSNPRAWTYVSKVLYQLDAAASSPELYLNAISGLVGSEMADGFYSFISKRSPKIPSAEILLANYKKHRKVIQDAVAQNNTAMLTSIVKSVILIIANPDRHPALEERNLWTSNLTEMSKDLIGDFREQVVEVIKEFTDAP